MKMPRFVLYLGGSHYIIPNNRGVSALINLMADAMPVRAHLYGAEPEIELSYADNDEMTRLLTTVEITRIPRGVKWKQRTNQGEVVEVRPVEKPAKALGKAAKVARLGNGDGNGQRPRLGNKKPLQLEFGQ